MTKDAHIVLATMIMAAGCPWTTASAITVQEAVSHGLKDLPPAADQTLFASHSQRPLASLKGHRAKVAEHHSAAAEFKSRHLRENAALRVSEVYFDMLRAHYRLSAAQRQVGLHEEALAANQHSAEKQAIEERLAVAQAALRHSIAELEEIHPAFLNQVGVEPGQMEIPPVVAMLQEAVVRIDTKLNAGYLAAQEEAAARELEVELAKSQWRPHLNVEATDSMGETEPGTTEDQLPSVGQAIARAEASLAKALEIRVHAEQEASAALESYSQATARIQQQALSSADILSLANEIEVAYQAGKRSVLELLEVRNAQYREEIAFAESHIEQRRHAYRLLAATGQLVNHLGIKTQLPKPSQVIATAKPATKPERTPANQEIIAIVEAASTKEVAAIGNNSPVAGGSSAFGADGTPESPSEPEREGMRRLGSQIVALVEPAVSRPPTDLLPVSPRCYPPQTRARKGRT